MPDINRINRAVDDYAFAKRRARNQDERYSVTVNLLRDALGRDINPNELDGGVKNWVNALASSPVTKQALVWDLTSYVKYTEEQAATKQRNQEIRAEIQAARGTDHDSVIRDAINDYEDVRRRIYDSGGDLDGEEIVQARLELLDKVGFQGDFLKRVPTSGWSKLLYERDDKPDVNQYRLTEAIKGWMRSEERLADHRDQNRSIRDEIARDRDGDGLPSGSYKAVDGEFEWIDDVEDLNRFHGTQLPEGTIINEFVPSYGHSDSVNRPSIGNTPAVYATSDVRAALLYAQGNADDEDKGQLYDLTIKPDEVIDLDDCQDDATARKAIKSGFDVIECPEFWEQPETIILDPKQINIDKVYPVTDPEGSIYVPERDNHIRGHLRHGTIGSPIYISDEEMASIGNKSPSMPMRDIEYRGMPKRSTATPSRGRGQLNR